MRLLDIGGGFPGDANNDSDDKFAEIALSINQALETSFSDIPDIEIIAEPGRFFATSCGTLTTNVIGRKIIEKMVDDKIEKTIHYYVNSNLYGLFNNVVFDKTFPKFNLLNSTNDEPLYKSIIFGQTCDSMDKIVDGIMLPELNCGDWLVVENHGAYTLASASKFNGFELAEINYVFTF